jgi:hypothetical protein
LSYLFVSGDVGDAVYSWSEVQDLRWISESDLGYFASKCTASEYGRGYQDWSLHKAKLWIEDHFSIETDMAEEMVSVLTNKRRIAVDDYHIFESIFSKTEWIIWLTRYGYEVFGDDLGGMENIGSQISDRCQAHLLGLKMAFDIFDREKIAPLFL